MRERGYDDISGRQLERWRYEGVFSPVLQVPLVYGSVTYYPPGSCEQAIAVRELLLKKHKFEYVGWELWWRGYWADEKHWKPQLQKTAARLGLWRAASQHYTSTEIYEPFEVGVLADLANLDTGQISIADIISIRSEGAFDDYRRILQRILRGLQDREGKFSSLEAEFAVAAREEMAECDDKISQLTKRSNVLKEALKNFDRVLIGGASGSIGGILAGSPTVAMLGAAAGGAIRPLYDIVRGAWTNSPSSAGRTSLRNHFLVLNTSGSEGRR